MNNGILIYFVLQICDFSIIILIYYCFETFGILKCIFVFLVCLSDYLIVIFNAFIRFCVSLCIYEDVLKMFLNIFGNMSQKCEQFLHEIFFCDFLGSWGS